MPGRLPASGSISVGDASGADSSINALRNIKRSTTTNSEMAMSTLRDWFRSYVDGAGDPSSNFPGAGDTISFSDFYNLTIFGVQIELQNEINRKPQLRDRCSRNEKTDKSLRRSYKTESILRISVKNFETNRNSY